MAVFDIDKLRNLDMSYPGIKIASDLRGLELSIKAMEDFLPHIQEQYKLREKRSLDQKIEGIGIEPEEAKGQYFCQEVDDIKNIADVVFPRFFRATLIVSIWSVYESGIDDLCNYLESKEKKKLALKDIRGEHEDRLVKYFEGVLNMPPPLDNILIEELKII